MTLLFCLALLFFYARQGEPNLLVVNKEKVVISNLPKELEGFRIVQISDLHGKEFAENKLVEKVNGLQPDILVITGDVLDIYHRDYGYIQRVLGPMKAKFGKFFVSGNNEYTAELSWNKMEQAYRQAKVTVLHNQSYQINSNGRHLWLVGVDDPNTNHDRLNQALQGTDQAPKILLAHSPEIVNQASAGNIDLVLVGHTHGGQVRIPGLTQRPGLKNKVDSILVKANHLINRGLNFIWRHRDKLNGINLPNMELSEADTPKVKLPRAGTVFTYNMKPGFEQYIAGLYRVGNTQMYVNRGLGETRTPFRLFSPPEIVEVKLTRK